MSAEDNFRRIRSALNARRGRNTLLGVYTTRVFVTKRVWEGGRRGSDGGYTDYSIYQGRVLATVSGSGVGSPTTIGLEILPRPKCRFISVRERYESGGVYEDGDVKVNYIQPYWADPKSGVQKGFSPADIAPDAGDDSGVEVIYRLQGADQSGGINGEFFRRTSIIEKWGHYQLILKTRITTPGHL